MHACNFDDGARHDEDHGRGYHCYGLKKGSEPTLEQITQQNQL
jgi:hypothetical protein